MSVIITHYCSIFRVFLPTSSISYFAHNYLNLKRFLYPIKTRMEITRLLRAHQLILNTQGLFQFYVLQYTEIRENSYGDVWKISQPILSHCKLVAVPLGSTIQISP